jgi:hypothetical protein
MANHDDGDPAEDLKATQRLAATPRRRFTTSSMPIAVQAFEGLADDERRRLQEMLDLTTLDD